MTIYQEEMQRKAYGCGCATTYDESTTLMTIIHNGQQIADITPKGFMHYESAKISGEDSREVLEQLRDASYLVREYVGLYESSPPMKAHDVGEYHQLAEYGDIVLGGMYSQKYGFMFSSWSQSRDKTSVSNGDYSPSYEYSRQAFAIRAKMIDKAKIFTQEEAEELFKCAAFTRDNCESLTYDQDRGLMELMEKLQDAYPSLKDNPPSFDDCEAPILNM